MATRRGQQCKLCRFGVGVCQTGFRKVHMREDPECRLHGIAERMNVRAPQPLPVPQPLPAPTAAGGDATTSLQLLPAPTAPATAGGDANARSNSSPGGDSTYSTSRQPKTNGSPDKSQLAKRAATRTLKRGSHSAERTKQAMSSTNSASPSDTE